MCIYISTYQERTGPGPLDRQTPRSLSVGPPVTGCSSEASECDQSPASHAPPSSCLQNIKWDINLQIVIQI